LLLLFRYCYVLSTWDAASGPVHHQWAGRPV
jgi:hypothetical protein